MTRLRSIGIGSYILKTSQAQRDRNFSTFIRFALALSSAYSAVVFASARTIAAASQKFSRIRLNQAVVSAGEDLQRVLRYAPQLEEACDSKALLTKLLLANPLRERAQCTSWSLFMVKVDRH